MQFYISLLICCIFSFTSYAQSSFEGTVVWSVTVVNTDNRQAAQYQRNISEENLSGQNEAIVELEQQINDPEMQDILLANPIIKNNMLKRLEQLKSAQPDQGTTTTNAKSIFPSRILIRMKNQNSLTETEGGTLSRMVGDILYIQSQNTTYYIKDATQTYSVKPAPDTSRKVHVTVAKTKDTLQILTYSCIKYIITSTENDETNISNVWITRDIRNMNRVAFQSLSTSTGSLHNNAYDRMPGIPLRIESFEPGVKVTMEVTDISAQLLPDTDFTIPMTYKEAVFGY